MIFNVLYIFNKYQKLRNYFFYTKCAITLHPVTEELHFHADSKRWHMIPDMMCNKYGLNENFTVMSPSCNAISCISYLLLKGFLT